jgi:hypothetical protein
MNFALYGLLRKEYPSSLITTVVSGWTTVGSTPSAVFRPILMIF